MKNRVKQRERGDTRPTPILLFILLHIYRYASSNLWSANLTLIASVYFDHQLNPIFQYGDIRGKREDFTCFVRR